MSTEQSVIGNDEIAQRAYAIWEARGCPPGDGAVDWQAAQDELLAARVARNGTTQQRVQSWWRRFRDRIGRQG